VHVLFTADQIINGLDIHLPHRIPLHPSASTNASAQAEYRTAGGWALRWSMLMSVSFCNYIAVGGSDTNTERMMSFTCPRPQLTTLQLVWDPSFVRLQYGKLCLYYIGYWFTCQRMSWNGCGTRGCHGYIHHGLRATDISVLHSLLKVVSSGAISFSFI
jgi:hypothetical protein